MSEIFGKIFSQDLIFISLIMTWLPHFFSVYPIDNFLMAYKRTAFNAPGDAAWLKSLLLSLARNSSLSLHGQKRFLI